MKQRKGIALRREVYLILAGILIIAFAVLITQSRYVLQFSDNEAVVSRTQAWEQLAAAGVPKPTGATYCFAYDPQDETSTLIRRNVERMLQYMKKKAHVVELNGSPLSTKGCNAVILATARLGLAGDPGLLANYVEAGGHLFLARSIEDDDDFYRFYRKMGIIDVGPYLEMAGIRMTSNLLIGEKNFSTNEDFVADVAISYALDEEAKVYAEYAQGAPLLWSYRHGEGSIFVCNSELLKEKINRGLLTGVLSLLIPDTIYPVFNSKVMFIDDYPAPIPLGVDPVIFREYKRDLPTFFKDIWWADMLKAAQKYEVKYTAALIQSYNDQIEPPFEKPVDEDLKGLISYGREVLKSGGEVGLHGYNHQSLQLSKSVADEFGYQPWSGIEPMVQSLQEANRFFQRAFPKYELLSYVPPSNVLSPEGRQALKIALPNLASISSLYFGAESGVAYLQEFELAPDGILEMPRVSSGYSDDDWMHWTEANAATAHGYFSHFIHPDDLLDSTRGKQMKWSQLYEKYVDMLERVEHTYPWIRPQTASESALDVVNALTSSLVLSEETDGTIRGKIAPFDKKAYFIMRTNRKFTRLRGCDVKAIDDGVYLITANAGEFSIKLGEQQ